MAAGIIVKIKTSDKFPPIDPIPMPKKVITTNNERWLYKWKFGMTVETKTRIDNGKANE